MDIIQLQYFCAIIDEGSIAAASKKLYLTTSALSQAQKQLENEIGYPLFDRVKNRLKLNSYGSELEKKARILLKDYRDMLEAIDSFTSRTPTIGVCSDTSSSFRFFLPLIMNNFPQYAILGRQMTGKEITSSLLSGEFDLAITMNTYENDDRFGCIPLGADHMYVTVPRKMPQSKKDILSLSDLAGCAFITSDPENSSHERLVAAIQESCGVNTVINNLADYGIFRQIISTSDTYISFVSEIGMNYYDPLPNRAIIPLTDECMRTQINIAYLKNNEKRIAPIIDWFMEKYSEVINGNC